MQVELCSECGYPTGRAGRADDSIFIQYPDIEVGPLCEECKSKHRVCEFCGVGVYSSTGPELEACNICGLCPIKEVKKCK